jgi:SAM-dependent methyltransferase
VHWTPLHVAIRAVNLLVGREGKNTRVLDVGSGIGKVCLVGALVTGADFTGIERREYFARFANALSEDQSIPNARSIHGEMAALDWSGYDSFYLFNPFYENRMPTLRIDHLVCLSEGRYQQLIEVVEAKLASLRVGTRVVTYHGFGGRMPESYSLQSSEFIDSGSLDLWVKVSA